MYGGNGGRLAALAAGLFLSAGAGQSFAADLGGDCCADLEERVAELEATTARKGNRKVSLEVYGQINQSIIFWDDGFEDNAYVVTNDNSRSRIGFKGKAKINSDFEAGYRIEIGIRTANSKRFTQDNNLGDDNPTDVGLDVRDSFWYLKSKTYGTGSVGMQASATDAITEVNLTQTKDFAKYSDVEDTGLGLFLRTPDGGKSARSYRNLLGDSGDQPGDGDRRQNAVKYESPEIAGFTASASWGEDDYWDLALRYAGEFSGFKLAAGIGYLKMTDGPQTKMECAARGGGLGGPDEDCQQFGGSVSVIHEATGIFVNFGAGQKKDDEIDTTAVFSASDGLDNKDNFWAIQAGIERKFNTLGKTTIYGEYYDYEGGAINRTLAAGDAANPFGPGSSAAVWDTGLNVYGLGFAQGIDAAAMVLYFSYRHVEADLTVRQIVGGQAVGAIANSPIEDLDLFQTGAIIKF